MHIYSFPSTFIAFYILNSFLHFTVLNHVVPVEYYIFHEIERQAGVGFQGNLFNFPFYVKELPIIMYTARDLLKALK